MICPLGLKLFRGNKKAFPNRQSKYGKIYQKKKTVKLFSFFEILSTYDTIKYGLIRFD